MIDVILLVYNNEQTLKRAIECILSQSHKDFRLLIFDDCSTDGSREIIKDYKIKNKKIDFYFHGENLGVIQNLNFALSKVRSEFLLWACPDDEYHQSYLTSSLHMLQRDKLAAVLPKTKIVYPNAFDIVSYDKILPNNLEKKSTSVIEKVLFRKKNEQYCLFWHSLIRTNVLKEILPITASHIIIEEVLAMYFISQAGIGTVNEVLYTKHQSLIPYELRKRENCKLKYDLKGKILCVFFWTKVFLKFKGRKRFILLYGIWSFIPYSFFTRTKKYFYYAYKIITGSKI